MAVGADEHDILEVFVIQNLANISQNSPFVAAPLGLQVLIDTITIDNVAGLRFSSDIQELLTNYILVRRAGENTRIPMGAERSPFIL